MIISNLTIFGQEYYYFTAEPEYQAVLDKARSLGYIFPTNREMFYQNEMVKSLKLAGIWARLDQFYVWYHSANFGFSSINWINPSFLITRNTGLVNSTFLPKEGARISAISTGSPGSAFIGSFNSAIQLGKFQLGDASFGWVNGFSTQVDGTWSGVRSHDSQQIWFRQHPDSMRGRQYFQQGNGYTATVMNASTPVNKSNSFLITTRTVTNNKIFLNGNKYRDGAITYTGSGTTGPSSDVNYALDFGYKSNTDIETLRMAFTGGNLTEFQCLEFNTIWQNYINSI